MSGIDQLLRTQNLLAQALGAAQKCLPSDKHMTEARIHMRQALQRIETASKGELRKKKNEASQNHEKWWGDIVANSPYANMSKEAAMKSLSQLNELIACEKQKLADIEKDVASRTSSDPGILND